MCRGPVAQRQPHGRRNLETDALSALVLASPVASLGHLETVLAIELACAALADSAFSLHRRRAATEWAMLIALYTLFMQR